MILMQPVDNYQPISMINHIIKYLNDCMHHKPKVGVVLGSGLKPLSSFVQNKQTIKYTLYCYLKNRKIVF